MNKPLEPQANWQGLLQEIGQTLPPLGNKPPKRSIPYWCIGRHIVEFEQGGNEKVDYGSGLLDRLSKDLTAVHGKGFSRSNVFYMRKLYLSFSNSGTPSHKLSWSHPC